MYKSTIIDLWNIDTTMFSVIIKKSIARPSPKIANFIEFNIENWSKHELNDKDILQLIAEEIHHLELHAPVEKINVNEAVSPNTYRQKERWNAIRQYIKIHRNKIRQAYNIKKILFLCNNDTSVCDFIRTRLHIDERQCHIINISFILL